MASFIDLTAMPQLSFRYGGRDSAEFLATWERSERSEAAPGGEVTHVTWSDPATGLKVTAHVRRFEDYPAADWFAELENAGPADTPIIEALLPMDLSIPILPGERLRLHGANGSLCRMDDFLPWTEDLRPGGSKAISPRGGRSSNGAFPFMNLHRGGCGLVLGIGWSGQWAVNLVRSKETLRISAGMERTHLRLHPGERIRTPRVLLLNWEGADPEAGSNALRRLLIAHYLPRIDGQLVMPPAAQCLQAYFYLTGKASEEIEMAALPRAAELGLEAYWIDACWYGGEGQWWQEVGSWVVNRQKFPRGLKPISDAAHQAGMKFILWFEPERVRAGSLLHREHPEFLLRCEKDRDNLLLNLGLPEAQRYITDLISQRIAENGVDVYRQDFNFDPLPYWQAADAPDRVGMTEIRHVEGLYAFWDELRRRHPGLWIDNCASGGRRIDLETMSRSLPLWPSDFHDVCGLPFGQGLHVGDQCIKAGLARWVPLMAGGVWNFTPYSTRGQVIGGFVFGYHIDHKDFPADDGPTILTHQDVLAKGRTLLDDDFPTAQARAAIAEWKSIRHLFLGDFHMLLPLTVALHDWCAWQFHRDDLQAGIAMFFRRHRSPFPTMQAGLKRLDPAADYDVSLSPGYEERPRSRMRGEDLAVLSIAIDQAPGSVLLRYARAR